MITLNRHLQLRGDTYWIHFEPEETKNRRRLDFPWPEALQGALTRYLQVYRPVLLGARLMYDNPGDRLWGVSCQLTLYRTITNRTAEWLGQPVNPRSFRHAAATSIAVEDPVHVGIITPILGHSGPRTAELFYNKATSVDAVRRYQKHISKLRTNPSRR